MTYLVRRACDLQYQLIKPRSDNVSELNACLERTTSFMSSKCWHSQKCCLAQTCSGHQKQTTAIYSHCRSHAGKSAGTFLKVVRPSPPLPSLRSRHPLLRLGGLGERLSSPSGSGRSPAAKRICVHSGVKRMQFYDSRVQPPTCRVEPYFIKVYTCTHVGYRP